MFPLLPHTSRFTNTGWHPGMFFFSLISYIQNMEDCAVCFALSDCSELSYDRLDRLHIAHMRGTEVLAGFL